MHDNVKNNYMEEEKEIIEKAHDKHDQRLTQQ